MKSEIIPKYSLFLYIVLSTAITDITVNRILLMFVLLICSLFYLKEHVRYNSPIKLNHFMKSYIIYGVILTISSLYTKTPDDKVHSVLISYYTIVILLFFLGDSIRSERDVVFFLRAYVLGAIMLLLYMLNHYGLGMIEVLSQDNNIRLGDDISNSNTVGQSFAYGAVISTYFFMVDKRKILKVFDVGVIIVSFVLSLLSGSRKALLVLFAGSFIVIYFLNTDKKNVIKKAITILLSFIIVFLLYNFARHNAMFSTVFDRLDSLLFGLSDTTQLDESSRVRFEMIQTGLSAFLKNPFLGQGVYSSYNYFGTYSHNNFVEILMNTGAIGFITFYIPYVKNGIDLIRINKSDKIYGVIIFFYLWILLGGYGMVTYYAKSSMMMFMLVTCWLKLKKDTIINE